MLLGHQEWWKVARHLDEAQRALSAAMVHNVDDPRPLQALFGRLREGQAILLEIFRMKGLLPGGLVPGVPRTGFPAPESAEVVVASTLEQGSALVVDEPTAPAVDHGAMTSEPEQLKAEASNGVHAYDAETPSTISTDEP